MSDTSTTTPTPEEFLAAFPEFNDASKYPAVQKRLWYNVAIKALDPVRWGDYYEIGVYLFVAHHLALFANQVGRPGFPGRPPLLSSSKSVGGVSVSYDMSFLANSGGGMWNLTTYGMRWYDLANMCGAGGTQIGYGPLPPHFGPGFGGIDTG